jgi:transcriptional regulator with XRE-family HTH domain
MATQKLYAGVKLRETRNRLGLTQKAFAAKLGVSLPYLNQMENKNIVDWNHMESLSLITLDFDCRTRRSLHAGA